KQSITMNRECTGYESITGMPRREVLSRFGMGLGVIAAAELLTPLRSDAAPGGTATSDEPPAERGVLDSFHHAARAKRVIFLFQSGGPSQLDLVDYTPVLREKHGTELPAEIRMGQRLTAMSGNQSSLPLVGSPFAFQQHGESGAWISELLPHTASIADDICIIRSLHTEAINHGPAVTFVQAGSQIPGRPGIGAWLSYGLGASNANLPAFVVMVTKDKGGQPLQARLWGSGF